MLDTNVLVSATLNEGNARRLLRLCSTGNHRLLQSDATFDELARVLRYPWLRLEKDAIHSTLVTVTEIAETIAVQTRLHAAADPDDNRFLELAIDGHADAIVSGDHHLLELETFRGIPIWTPAVALYKLSP